MSIKKFKDWTMVLFFNIKTMDWTIFETLDTEPVRRLLYVTVPRSVIFQIVKLLYDCGSPFII